MQVAGLTWSPLRHRLNAIVANWQRLLKFAGDSYRPELHYMRGPGPKWRAKHRGASVQL
jgi:hypothetical protein